MSQSRQLQVVFMNVASTGHMNPTLPLVKELTARGCAVTYFVEDTMREVVEAAGAAWRPLRHPDSDFTGTLKTLDAAGIAKYVPEGTPAKDYEDLPMPLLLPYSAERILPALLDDLRALKPAPSVIVHDPFIAFALVAGHVLDVPAITFLTMPGPGTFTRPDLVVDAQEAVPWVEGPRRAIQQDYGFDIFEKGIVMEHYSPLMTLVTTAKELFAPPVSARQLQRFGSAPFRCVGPLIDASVQRLRNANIGHKAAEATDAAQVPTDFKSGTLPWAHIDEQLAVGRKLVFVSLGTVATAGILWNKTFGDFARSNGLADLNGREFCQHVWRVCFEALGGDDRFLVVMSLGSMPDALDGLPDVPENFILRDAVPQMELLPRCSAFVTHGGANSMHEALAFGLPLAVVPMFGDQPTNAATVERCGAGVSFAQPMSTLTVEALRDAMASLVLDGEGNSFRKSAMEMSEKLRNAGGIPAAVGIIMKKAWTAPVCWACTNFSATHTRPHLLED
mmetsp:Transcript_134550/g.429773  ORF Transcript_134550/g.429773 Transcript_134550/m.429773 type:complete len:505 (+) Transcript_134550:101-1615(+)